MEENICKIIYYQIQRRLKNFGVISGVNHPPITSILLGYKGSDRNWLMLKNKGI